MSLLCPDIMPERVRYDEERYIWFFLSASYGGLQFETQSMRPCLGTATSLSARSNGPSTSKLDLLSASSSPLKHQPPTLLGWLHAAESYSVSSIAGNYFFKVLRASTRKIVS
jgi:hypothetical protein